MIDENNYNRTFTQDELDKYIQKSPLVKKIQMLVEELRKRELRTTSSGHLDKSNLEERLPYCFSVYPMRAWEYCRTYEICGIEKGKKVLDCGGASSPIVFFAASEGASVTTIDLQKSLVKNTMKVSRIMNWDIDPLVADMTEIPFKDETFDVVISISVLEHLPNDVKTKALKEFRRVLKKGGIAGITFDFGKSLNAKTEYDYQKHDQFHTPLQNVEEIMKYIVEPSGMEIHGNKIFTQTEIDPDKEYMRRFFFEYYEGDLKYKVKQKIRSLLGTFDIPYYYYTFFTLFLRKL
ncbi:MAG: class I SAM-dependent methyltransferase [Candidatus Coatesbacteria bacterium]|nr:class I SAM-dependent methyltransferase [Candidatus Coatesbacteria bacterium]